MKIYTEDYSGDIRIDETVMPSDLGNRHYRAALQEVQSGEATITPYSAPVPTDEEKITEMKAVVQSLLNIEARKLGYDDIFTAVSYATSSDATFGPQGIAFRNWRDSVWNAAYVLLATWQAGGTEPTKLDVVAALPAFVAP